MTLREMNEQVALRLRWTKPNDGRFPHFPWQHPGGGLDRYQAEELPPWSTDPGRAFAELWDKILAIDPTATIVGHSGKVIACELDDYKGETWAEAICLAFIALVPLEGTK